ncbi:MAG: HipA N-terminal domain-containing protein [Candidatus Omnitrophica bacterium]|nr:HipA N-terminal domain-containing protein [Candidatus Omnitrophota bacterium]
MNIMRKAEVFYNDELAGYLSEATSGYIFQYDFEFLKKNIPIAVSLPPRAEPYQSKELFPFFKGLLPEGWYLDIVSATQKIDSKDYFGLLIGTASADTAGSVTIQKVDTGHE